MPLTDEDGNEVEKMSLALTKVKDTRGAKVDWLQLIASRTKAGDLVVGRNWFNAVHVVCEPYLTWSVHLSENASESYERMFVTSV